MAFPLVYLSRDAVLAKPFQAGSSREPPPLDLASRVGINNFAVLFLFDTIGVLHYAGAASTGAAGWQTMRGLLGERRKMARDDTRRDGRADRHDAHSNCSNRFFRHDQQLPWTER